MNLATKGCKYNVMFVLKYYLISVLFFIHQNLLKKFYKAFDFTLRNFYEFVNKKACDI